MIPKRRSRLAATLFAATALVSMASPASATIHEIVASFCSGGNSNVFPPGQSDFAKASFLRALQASGAVTIRPDTPTAGAITLDYNNDARAGKFAGSDEFVEAIPGVWIEVLEPDHAAFDHCTNFTFGGQRADGWRAFACAPRRQGLTLQRGIRTLNPDKITWD